MRSLVFLYLITILYSCTQGNEDNSSTNKTKTDPDTVSTNENEQDDSFILSRINETAFVFPEINKNPGTYNGTVQFGSSKDGVFFITITYDDGTKDDLRFSGENLVARITPIAFNQNFHQQLAVYLFEKQWHLDTVAGSIENPEIGRYEIVNPPKTPFWFLNAYSKSDPDVIVASYGIKIPEKEYAAIFEKINNKKYADFKNVIFNAPETNKIQYNSLRKLGRFNEGIVADLKDLKFDPDQLYNTTLIKKPASYSEFYVSDFSFPELTDNGYDTSKLIPQSLKEFHSVKSFSYKTSYTLTGIDSTLEMQLDFKTKDNLPTIRFVMGGIVFEKIPRLKSHDMKKGLYLPLGFQSYNDPNITMDSYVLMGNTSGMWVDNSYGRNIDGILLYFDKISPLKIHIWLMSGDGSIPVGHYVTTLNKLQKPA